MKVWASTVAALVLSTSPVLAAGESAPIRASYDVYFGGLHILSAVSEFSRADDAYTLTATSKTEGILSAFWDWRGETRSQGRYVAGRALPTRHESRGLRGDETKVVELTYDSGGEVSSVRVDPPLDPEEVTELPDGAEIGTIDPLSVIAELSRVVASDGRCDGEFAVFDGRRRYDLRITDQGAATLPETPYSIFSGAVMACGVEYSLLGGERREKSRYATTARDRVVYVARPLADGPAMPVALKIETDFGTLMAHLTAVEGAAGSDGAPTTH